MGSGLPTLDVDSGLTEALLARPGVTAGPAEGVLMAAARGASGDTDVLLVARDGTLHHVAADADARTGWSDTGVGAFVHSVASDLGGNVWAVAHDRTLWRRTATGAWQAEMTPVGRRAPLSLGERPVLSGGADGLIWLVVASAILCRDGESWVTPRWLLPNIDSGEVFPPVGLRDNLWLGTADAVYHWEGSEWTLDSAWRSGTGLTPPRGPYCALAAGGDGVPLLVSAEDVWARRLDGSWAPVAQSSPAAIVSVVAVSATEAWCVAGDSGTRGLWHLKGGSWTQVPSPTALGAPPAVVAASPSGVETTDRTAVVLDPATGPALLDPAGSLHFQCDGGWQRGCAPPGRPGVIVRPTELCAVRNAAETAIDVLCVLEGQVANIRIFDDSGWKIAFLGPGGNLTLTIVPQTQEPLGCGIGAGAGDFLRIAQVGSGAMLTGSVQPSGLSARPTGPLGMTVNDAGSTVVTAACGGQLCTAYGSVQSPAGPGLVTTATKAALICSPPAQGAHNLGYSLFLDGLPGNLWLTCVKPTGGFSAPLTDNDPGLAGRVTGGWLLTRQTTDPSTPEFRIYTLDDKRRLWLLRGTRSATGSGLRPPGIRSATSVRTSPAARRAWSTTSCSRSTTSIGASFA
jgi:hypothetical protein